MNFSVGLVARPACRFHCRWALGFPVKADGTLELDLSTDKNLCFVCYTTQSDNTIIITTKLNLSTIGKEIQSTEYISQHCNAPIPEAKSNEVEENLSVP